MQQEYLPTKGKWLMSASWRIEAPRQRNTREENKHIKETGTVPEAWKENPHKLCQKDTDARWTKKNEVVFYPDLYPFILVRS
jgi:hypothetical protein